MKRQTHLACRNNKDNNASLVCAQKKYMDPARCSPIRAGLGDPGPTPSHSSNIFQKSNGLTSISTMSYAWCFQEGEWRPRGTRPRKEAELHGRRTREGALQGILWGKRSRKDAMGNKRIDHQMMCFFFPSIISGWISLWADYDKFSFLI